MGAPFETLEQPPARLLIFLAPASVPATHAGKTVSDLSMRGLTPVLVIYSNA
jgi:hypothetical protein